MYFFILICFCVSQVYCQTKEPCELEDVKCVTEGAQPVYQHIVSGVPAIDLETSDPMHVDLIESLMPTFNYSLRDCYWTGLKDCHIENLQLQFKNMSWHMYLSCPLLVLSSDYYAHGEIESVFMEGEGKSKIIFDNYHISILADMEMYTDAEGKDHVNLTNLEVDMMDPRGFVEYMFENFFYGDDEKSKSVHKIINDRWKEMNIATQGPAMYALSSKLVENINKYLKAFSINELFYNHG